MLILNSLIISSLAGFSTMIGVIPVFIHWKEENISKIITCSLSLSMMIMIGISFLELIPEATYTILSKYKTVKGILICILVLIISTMIMKKIHKIIEKGSGLYQIGVLSAITLIIHNIPEGIITFYSTSYSIQLGMKIALSIMLHNIPEGICIAMPIYIGTGSKFKALLYTFTASIAEPIGAIMSYIFLKNILNEVMIAFILILTAGFMITLSMQHIMPKAIKYHQNKYFVLGLILGIILIFITNRE